MTTATQDIKKGLSEMSEGLRATFLNEMITRLMAEVEDLQRNIDFRDAVGFDDYSINLNIELSKYRYSKKRLIEAKELLVIYFEAEKELTKQAQSTENSCETAFKKEECKYYIKAQSVEKRPVNGLNVEPMSPSARCLLKIPSNWESGKGLATRWLFSGGSPLVFGLCAGQCPFQNDCTK